MKWQRETAEVGAMKFTAFSQFRAQNGRASMRFYSAAPYRGHLSAGICFCLSVGGCVEPQEEGDATVNMTDGCDDGIWAALEQTRTPKISRYSASWTIGVAKQRPKTLRADGAPVRTRCESIYLAARTNEIREGDAPTLYFFFSLLLPFRPCISRDSKIPLEFLPFPRLIGQFIWLSWSGVNWLIELMNFNQKCEREIDLGSYLFEIKILIETNPRRNFQNSVFQNLNAEYTWYIKVIYPFIALLYSVFYIARIDKMKNSRCKFGSF